MNNIGEKIKWLREQKLLTREEFADILLVNPSTIRKWEKGKMTPRESNIIKICRLWKLCNNKSWRWNIYTIWTWTKDISGIWTNCSTRRYNYGSRLYR